MLAIIFSEVLSWWHQHNVKLLQKFLEKQFLSWFDLTYKVFLWTWLTTPVENLVSPMNLYFKKVFPSGENWDQHRSTWIGSIEEFIREKYSHGDFLVNCKELTTHAKVSSWFKMSTIAANGENTAFDIMTKFMLI